MKSDEKTNVMRLLDSRKIPYTAHTYAPDPALSGEDIARILGEDPSYVFKTLVTRGKTGRYYVFVIPVAAELTGYVHGGCSPVGMKKPFPTFVHSSANGLDRIFVSAGRVGFQMELAPADLSKLVRFRFAELISD